MKRPMHVIGFSCLAVSVLLCRISAVFGVVLACLCIASFVVTVSIRKTRQAMTLPTAFLSAAFACLLLFTYTTVSFTPAANCCSESTHVEAHIISLPVGRENNGSWRYVVKTQSIGEKKISRKMRLTVYNELNADIYDNISFDGRVFLLGDDGGEYSLYYKAVRMYLGAYTSKPVNVSAGNKKTPYYYVLIEKQKISEKISALLPGDEGGLLTALLFGDKSGMSQELKDNMQKAGLSHLTAVSGMHLSAWSMLVAMLFKRLKLSRKITALISAVPVVAVMAFSAFSTSVMRAGTMILLYFVACFVGEKTEGLNSLGFACFVLILFNPYIVCDASFLLSVCATAGVLLCAQSVLEGVEGTMKMRLRRFYYVPLTLISAALISLFAQIFTLPVTIYYFGTVSPYSILANVAVSLPSVLCMYLTPALLVLSGIPFAGKALSGVLGFVSSYVIKSAGFVSSLPCASVRADYPYVYICIAVSGAVFAVMYAVSKKPVKSMITSAAAGLAVILVSAAVYYSYDASHVRVATIPTGDGLCVMIERHGRADVIGCMGEYYTANEIGNEADRRNLIVENVILPSENAFDKSNLKKIAEKCPQAQYVSSEIVETGLENVKKGNAVLHPCEDVEIKVENGFAKCVIYGTEIIIGTDYNDGADILITDSVPDETGMYENVIVQSQYGTQKDNVYYTSEDGKTEITVNKNGFRIKR